MKRVALITGSGSGVGRACAVRFAKLGFDLVVNYLGSEDEAQETRRLAEIHGAEVLLANCDVSQNEEVVEMLRKVEDHFGRLDLVVNSAGTTHFIDHTDLDAMDEAKWDSILAVNTKGPFFVIRAAIPLLQQSGNAAVVNISSAAALSGSGSSIAYCASKGALNTMTKSLAKAFAPQIRINAVCPGPIDSTWLRQGMTEKEIDERVSVIPIPELIQPNDVADTVVYLALESSKSTGQILVLDGGRTM